MDGQPKSIVCYRDPTFRCTFWKELFLLNGTFFNFSSNHHPQMDGQSKVVNKTLKMYIRCFTSSQPKEWFKCLYWVEYCYNTSWQSTVWKTPFEVVYRKNLSQLIDYIPRTAKLEAIEHELISWDWVLEEVQECIVWT